MTDDLLITLKTTFGYDAFRPLQRDIIEASLAGKDVFALLPTGGGKSLCFQLPALVRPGLTVVVSPLIALMKDQVDQLQAAGVAATFLNSSLGSAESRSRLAGLHRNEWRLLYVAPERLMLDNWQENLKAWNVAAIAIDEAHCVSEWGHDFRPEYRQIAKLRELLPEVPVMALTATATERVRIDIVKHLKLRDPQIYVASFNRPNLTYRVTPKDQPAKQIMEFVKRREHESGIVYCATRATADRTAEALAGRGLPARAYHAGLDADERASFHPSRRCPPCGLPDRGTPAPSAAGWRRRRSHRPEPCARPRAACAGSAGDRRGSRRRRFRPRSGQPDAPSAGRGPW